MQVKTFEALTIKDAVKAVKKEFGQNAIILSTREKSVTGAVAGNDLTKTIEVTAAIPDGQHTNRDLAATSNYMSPHLSKDNDFQSKIDSVDLKLSALIERSPVKSNIHYLETSLHEMKMLLLETLRTKEGSTIKNLPAHLVNLDRSLRAMGIEEVHLVKLMQGLMNHPQPKTTDGQQLSQEEYYRAQAIRWMLKKIKIAPQWTLMDGQLSIHAFVGSTGVGKTTVISKLAAHYHIKKKKKVAIVSFDPYRLAASEQLRIYSKIIDVPFISINQPEELTKRILDLKDIELVLIDTAGYSSKNTKLAASFENLRKIELPLDMHLVLPVTEKEDQIDRTIRFFSQSGIQSLIFSKLDESWSYGTIFNISQRWSLPLSFFSTGQEIPDDIERATRERVVERIFGI